MSEGNGQDRDETLGSSLERRRLTDRAQRLESAIAVLRVRARSGYDAAVPPPGLRRAIRAFEEDLERVQQRLRRLSSARR